MAKTKKKKKKSTNRRSRGMGAVDTQSLIALAVGALGAKLLNKVIPDTLNKNLVAGGKIAVGVFLPMISKDGKTKAMLGDVGKGFVVVGTLELAESFGIGENVLGGNDSKTLAVALEGIEDVEFEDISDNVLGDYDDEYMDGDDLNVINADEDLSVVNADDDDY